MRRRGLVAVVGVVAVGPRTETAQVSLSLPPGQLVVACLPGRRDSITGDAERYAELSVVDPQGLWISPDLDCSDFRKRPIHRLGDVSSVPVPSLADALRETVPGLCPRDLLQKPGYPETEWHTALFVRVVRGDRAVAWLMVWRQRDRWVMGVTSCPGSGIGVEG